MIESKQNEFKRIIIDSLVQLKPFETGESPHMEKIPGIEAVLFDVYGTLLISGTGDIGISHEKENHYKISDILKSCGCKLHGKRFDDRILKLLIKTITEHHEIKRKQGIVHPEVCIPEIWKTVIDSLLDDRLIECDPEQLDYESIALRYELLVNPVWLMPGFPDITDSLKNTFKIGIVSNAQFYTPLTIEALTGRSMNDIGFKEELCFWSYKYEQAKPSPFLYEKAAEILEKRHGIDREKVLFVGNDMLNDVFAAFSVGFKTCLFAGDKRSLRKRSGNEICSGIKPDSIITNLNQILEIL